jgi:hypothetical protein
MRIFAIDREGNVLDHRGGATDQQSLGRTTYWALRTQGEARDDQR